MERTSRNLVPWYVGIIIVLLAVVYTGYHVVIEECAPPAFYMLAVLVVIPIVYLSLMYFTFTSQR